MLYGCCLVFSLLTATPGDVVLVRQLQTTPERAADVVERIFRAVTDRGVVLRAPRATRDQLGALSLNVEACGARRACLIKVLQRLGGPLLITIDVGHVADEMAIGLEALTAEGQSVAARRFTLKTAGYPAGFEDEVRRFADALEPFASAPSPRSDAPLSEAPPPPPPLVPAQPTTRPRTTLALVTGGTAAASAVAAIVFAVLGSNLKAQLDRARFNAPTGPASHLTELQARSLAASANTDFSLSLGFTLASAALTSVLAWALLAPEPTP